MIQLNEGEKPTVFIGSSSEGLEVARILQAQLHEFNAYVWDQGLFTPGSYPMEVLDRQIKIRDFAIFVCTPDDPIVKRKQESTAVRDNVIFELGLFMGAMGRERAIMVLPSHANVELPSDLSAITQVRYNDERFKQGYQEQIPAIQSACLTLRHHISTSWGRIQANKRKLIQSMTADKRTKSIRRLYTVIVQMRDLIIVFPAQLFDALTDHQRFETVKSEAALSVERLVDAFHEDAATSNLAPELQQLAAATKSALLHFPFPVDPTEVSKSVRSTIGIYATKIAGNIITNKDPMADIGNMVGTEIEKQLRVFVEKYELWWKESRSAIESATSKLQDSLMTASLTLNEGLHSGYHGIIAA